MKAQTVKGLVDVNDLGTTLIHEHLVFDFRDYFEPNAKPTNAAEYQLAQLPISLELAGSLRFNPFMLHDNLLHKDIDLTVQELREFVALGGKTVVDPTNVSIGRDPRALRTIAELTGLHIVMGAGYYFEISLGESVSEEVARGDHRGDRP